MLVAVVALGAGGWWLNQWRITSAAQAAFEQALQRHSEGPSAIEPSGTAAAPSAAASVPPPAQVAAQADTQPLPDEASRTTPAVVEPEPAPKPALAPGAEPAKAAAPAASVASLPAPSPQPAATDRAPTAQTPSTAVAAAPARQAAPAVATSGTESAARTSTSAKTTGSSATKPHAEAAPARFNSPRSVCGTRTDFALYRCIQTQCAQKQWAQHPVCKRFRQTDQVD